MNITWENYSEKHKQTALTKLDIEILALEKKIRQIYKQMNRLPNNSQRLALYNKMQRLIKKQKALVYANGGWGSFKHLLKDGRIRDELIEEVE